MDIFISWSGERARVVARTLRDWLRCVIQPSKPWMSEEDLGPGTRWSIELARRLEATNFGILCLTKESLNRPWVLFEAGALAKALSEARVCPLLIDLDPRDLPPPLAQFNAVPATETGVFQLVRSINRATQAPGDAEPLEEDVLRRTFEKWWPDLHAQLAALPPPSSQPTLVMSGNDMGIEYVFEGRGPALERFSEYIEHELAKSQLEEEAGISIVGTSLRAFFVPAERNFDGKDIIRRALEYKCPLRFMLTEPEVSDRRARQEGRRLGEIPEDIRRSVRDLLAAGVPKESIRYYGGSPTVFGIATTEYMLLNPYPLEQESHRCFALIVRKTDYRKDIYHQYRKVHFDDPWDHSESVPETDWGQIRAV